MMVFNYDQSLDSKEFHVLNSDSYFSAEDNEEIFLKQEYTTDNTSSHEKHLQYIFILGNKSLTNEN